MTVLTQAQRGLVERLRDADISGHGTYSALVREAADEIERLNAARILDGHRMLKMSDDYEADQAEIERLEAALDTCRELREYDLAVIRRLQEVVRSMGGTP